MIRRLITKRVWNQIRPIGVSGHHNIVGSISCLLGYFNGISYSTEYTRWLLDYRRYTSCQGRLQLMIFRPLGHKQLLWFPYTLRHFILDWLFHLQLQVLLYLLIGIRDSSNYPSFVQQCHLGRYYEFLIDYCERLHNLSLLEFMVLHIIPTILLIWLISGGYLLLIIGQQFPLSLHGPSFLRIFWSILCPLAWKIS